MVDPLEQFLLGYVDAIDGLADCVEPQVYDVLFPDADQPVRVAFDPDALPEHPSAQLLTFGSTLLGALLEKAHARGRVAITFLDDVHLAPHALEQRVKRDLFLPQELTLDVNAVRPLYVTHSVFWFEATFLSDEKEQALYPIAIDRYYGRQVRYLEPLLEGDRLSDIRRWAYPDAPLRPLDQAYLAAREAVVRTVKAEVKTGQHEIQTRLVEQTERMKRYYADLRAELSERLEKAKARGEETESLQPRLAALDREEAVRLEELQRKAVLRVQLKLANLLHVKIPRLFLIVLLSPIEGKRVGLFRPKPLTLTWDPLAEKTDALDCPNCQHPTYELRLNRFGALTCPSCDSTLPKR